MKYKRKYKERKSVLTSVEKTEGESIERKVRRLIDNKEPIKDGAPEIYTERKEGVIQAYNIRADRWEIATDAMDKVQASIVAKRDSKPKVEGVIDLNADKEKESGEAKTTDGNATPKKGSQ